MLSPPRSTVLAIVLAAVLPVAWAAAPVARATPDPSLEQLLQLPLGDAVLALEREAGAAVDDATDALRRVVRDARSRLPVGTPEGALAAVAESARLVCPTVEAGRAGTLFSEALQAGACDCDVLTILYLTVADEVGLPLAAVLLPNHMLVAWGSGPRTVYWETTVAEARPAWLLEALVPQGSGRAYLRPQSRRELIGHALAVRAAHRLDAGDVASARADFDRALGLSPASVVGWYNRGHLHLLAGRAALAVADFERALALDPSYADAWYGLALATLVLDRPAAALDAIGRVMALEGPSADAHHVQGLAHAAAGDDDAALRSFDAAVALAPNAPLAYEARGAAHERRGNAEAARRDYAAFVRLAPGTEHEPLVAEVAARLDRLAPRAG